jgi:hypothetical protein
MSKTRTAGAPRASTTVEDFDGVAAAHAAVALRRAGLRPALERTFHWGAETRGLVVAQEPPAGSDVPLDSTVLLFISAPGERKNESDNRGPLDGDLGTSAPELNAEVSTGAAPRRPRRRKARRARLDEGPSHALNADAGPSPPLEDEHDFEPAPRSERSSHNGGTGGPRDERNERLLLLAQARLEEPADRARRERLIPLTLEAHGLARLALAALCGMALALLLFLAGADTHALQAAGAFNGTPISGVQTFVDKLRGNLVWLGGTAMGLVIAVVGIMFMAGHSRAHDLAIRTIVGLAILASISGIVA